MLYSNIVLVIFSLFSLLVSSNTPIIHGKWPLSKYAKWEAGSWKLINKESNKELVLLAQEANLLVINGQIALEMLSLTQDNNYIKSVYKNGTLVIAMKFQAKSTKFRVLFASLEEAENCITFLSKFIEIESCEKDVSGETLPALLKKIMKNDEPSLPAPECIPDDYPLEAAIQLCILDPGFPALVSKIESIVNSICKTTNH